MLILWSPDYDIGHAKIDDDHRHVVDTINRLNDATGNEELAAALKALHSYVREHFEREERLMEAGGYPDLVAHKALHADFRQRIDSFEKTVAAGAPSHAGSRLLLELAHWWTTHIRKTDPNYLPWIK